MLEASEPPLGPQGDTARNSVDQQQPTSAAGTDTQRPKSKLDRPRKKLSFREPEIVGCEKYRQMKEKSSGEQKTESIIKGGRTDGDGAPERMVVKAEVVEPGLASALRESSEQTPAAQRQETARTEPGNKTEPTPPQSPRPARPLTEPLRPTPPRSSTAKTDPTRPDVYHRCNSSRSDSARSEMSRSSSRNEPPCFEPLRNGSAQASADRPESCALDERSVAEQVAALADPAFNGSSIEDLSLQEQAIMVVRSVRAAFEQSRHRPQRPQQLQLPEPEPEPEPGSPERQPSDTDVGSQRGSDEQLTPAAESAPNSPAVQRSSLPPQMEASELLNTPPPVKRSPAATNGTERRRAASAQSAESRRPARRQRRSRSPALALVSPAGTERRHLQAEQLQQMTLDTLYPLPPTAETRFPMMELRGDDLRVVSRVPASLSLQHQIQLLRERLLQQQQQTQAALAQVHLVRDQLQAETAARLEAQMRSHQLLQHNRQLLEHAQMLVVELQEMEAGALDGLSPDASSTSLSSGETARPDPDLQLLRDLEQLSAMSLPPPRLGGLRHLSSTLPRPPSGTANRHPNK